ncbi:MAG: hypothetical protein QF357_10245, partial [Dehalococcoidia bacterium]|nr:hypothetical protein [Dehalococcoidia bacterium]
MTPSYIDISTLIERYDGLLFDSFGVLVDGIEALPGALELVDRMNAGGVNYFIVTNDASESIDSRIATFRSQGFEIPGHRIVNSGSLIAGYYREHGLEDRPTVVLGTQDARDYVIAAGGRPVEMPGPNDSESTPEPDVVVVGHSGPHDWEATLEVLLGLFSRRYEQGNPARLVLPNPDFVYPNGPGSYRFGAAA